MKLKKQCNSFNIYSIQKNKYSIKIERNKKYKKMSKQVTNEFEKLSQAIKDAVPNYIRQDSFAKSFDELHKEVSPYKSAPRQFQGDGKDIPLNKN